MNAEKLIQDYDTILCFEETDFKSNKLKGLCVGDTIFYKKGLSQVEKSCIIAEEIGHYETSTGNILDIENINSKKQERAARMWAAKELIPLDKIVEASKQGITTRYELAEYLEVTEEFLQEVLDFMKEKFGLYIEYEEYLITLEPLGVMCNM